MDRIGLIAGGGKLPIIFAREAKKKGVKVIGFAIKEMALPEFNSACDRAHHVSAEDIKKFVFLLVIERIKKIVMLGKVDKAVIYKIAKKDKRLTEILENSADRNDYTLLSKVTAEFKKIGIEVVSGTEYMSELLPRKGVLTKRHPSEEESGDMEFGLKRAREMARLDIGQTIVVKDKVIVGVEAMGGTDTTIETSARICGEGFTVIKVARPDQDMRWDVPTVGPETLKLIAKNKGHVLVLEEKKMFLIEKETCVKIADDNGISIVVV